MDILYDLVEFRYCREKKTFVKFCTHKYNVPYAIAEVEKRRIQFLTPKSLYTRFKIVRNGTFQYKNQFNQKNNEKEKTN